MKARNISERLIVLCEGTQLIPTADPVTITTKETSDKFTKLLAEKGSIVLTDQPTPVALKEEPDTTPVFSPEESELREALKGKTKDELKMIAEESGIEVNSRSTNSQIIDLIVAQAQENGEI